MFTSTTSVSPSAGGFGSAPKASTGFSFGGTNTSATGVGGLFGTQPAAATYSSAFGTPSASGGLFGSGGAAVASPASTGFGVGAATGFGATTTGGFGSYAAASPFGVPQPATASLFGQPSSSAFGVPARPAFAPQRPCANPFGGGLSTRECFSANEDKRFGRQASAKPASSWRPSAAPAVMAPVSTFPGTGNKSPALFGSVQTSTPVTGWHFGGASAKPQPPSQPTTPATWSGSAWNQSHWTDPTHPPYAPTVERDPISGQLDKLVSISSMPSYSHQSVEELRLEHDNKPVGLNAAVNSARAATAWTTKKDSAWTGFTAQPPSTIFGPAAKQEADTPSNPFARFQPLPTSGGVATNPFGPKPTLQTDGFHFHCDPVPQNPKPTWPLPAKDVKTSGFHFHVDPLPQNPKPTWPLVAKAVKPATDWSSFRFGVTETAKSSPSFSLFTQPQPETQVAAEPKPEAKEPEPPVVVPNEDFPYGSGDFGAGLVEQTVRSVLSTTPPKANSNDPLALPVVSSQRPASRAMGGSRAAAFVRRSAISNSKALLAHGIRHTVTASRKPTITSPPAKKPIERIVVGRRDAEPWKRSGLHLKTSLFAKTIGSAAAALTAAQDEQQDAAVENVEGSEESPATDGDDDLDNYDL